MRTLYTIAFFAAGIGSFFVVFGDFPMWAKIPAGAFAILFAVACNSGGGGGGSDWMADDV